jgi:hypothetical protein
VEDTDSRPITQPHTQAWQEALAHARGHSGRFHATGGMHVTSDDMFISMEINAPNEKRAAIEKEKKLRLILQANEEKAMVIINQGKPLNLLSVADLDVLLAWHQAPKMKDVHKKKAEKVQQWMMILGDGGQPPAYERWTDEDEQRLGALATTEDIDMIDTQYGRKMALKKRIGGSGGQLQSGGERRRATEMGCNGCNGCGGSNHIAGRGTMSRSDRVNRGRDRRCLRIIYMLIY